MRKILSITIPALIMLLIDQAFKYFSDDFVKNPGSVFGFVPIMWPSIVFAIVFLILFVVFYSKIPEDKMMNIGLGLLLGGVISNLIDRIARGFVIDYIFPPSPLGKFNIADVGIWVGGVLIIIYLLNNYKKL